jgi:hypothetical protein
MKVGTTRYMDQFEVPKDDGDAFLRNTVTFDPPLRLVKLAPLPPKRIRPATRMSQLALKLLAVGMASAQVR